MVSVLVDRPLQMDLVVDQQVIETFPAHRTDHPLDVRIGLR
jgi:hypothetical protein